MQIAFVTYPGLTALDLVGPLDVLARVPGVRPLVVAADGPGPVPTDNRVLRIEASASLDKAPAPKVVLVPGGLAGTRAAARDPRLLAWLQHTAATADWVASVCTGSLVLGAAGLLEGRRATSHWLTLDELADHGATPQTGRFVVDGNVVTAAGVSAGLDLALWLAGQLAGEDIARVVQLVTEYEPDPPYDAGSPTRAGRALTEVARAALEHAFDQPIPS